MGSNPADCWAALDGASWETARVAFEAAIAEDETPDLVEGYSWALWWLNVGDQSLAARERAYKLYRDQDDPRGAGRVATWLASDVIDFRCDTAISNGWLRRARRLLDSLEPCPEQGWLDLHEGTLALDLSGDTATARALARRCAATGSVLEDLDLQMLGRALGGLAAVHEGAVAEGLSDLDEVATVAITGELSEYVSVGWSCCSLIKACEEVRDYERAAQWSQQMVAFAQRIGFEPWARLCRSFHAWVLVSQGSWDDAERELLVARERLAATRPPWTVEAVVRLAELRRRQGRLEEATELFEGAMPHPRALVGLAATALDQGDPHGALALARRALRTWEGDLPRTDRLAPLELLVRSLAVVGDAQGAILVLQELAAVTSRLGTIPAKASLEFHVGLVALCRSEFASAREQLEDARDLFRRCHAPYEAAVASLELSRCLLEMGETEAAERIAAEALEDFERLGAGLGVEAVDHLRQKLATAARVRASQRTGAGALSAREREVLTLVAQGLSDREVAGRLALSEHTVHRHMSNILRKLGVRSRTAAVAQATHHGLL